jgi:hypothetical protein
LKKEILLIFLLLFFSCKKDKELDPCLIDPIGTNSTLKRIIALEEKHNLDSNSINLYSNFDSFSQKTNNYFVITNTSPVLKYNFFSNAEIINCEGTDIAQYFDKDEYTVFFKSAKFVKKIWKKEKTLSIENKGTCNTLNPLVELPYFIKLNSILDKYAWKSLIYQYNYKGQTVYYGLYTSNDKKETKYITTAAMTCDGTNLQESTDWSQSDFLQNAKLERKIR